MLLYGIPIGVIDINLHFIYFAFDKIFPYWCAYLSSNLSKRIAIFIVTMIILYGIASHRIASHQSCKLFPCCHCSNTISFVLSVCLPNFHVKHKFHFHSLRRSVSISSCDGFFPSIFLAYEHNKCTFCHQASSENLFHYEINEVYCVERRIETKIVT